MFAISEWKSNSHSKFLLQYHIIFVCKYRKKLLIDDCISNEIKQLSFDICSKHNIAIKEMETDKDHIHYMIETIPNVNLSNVIKMMKSYTTFHIWKNHKRYLSKHFWKENTFWTDGYFVCSIGNVSEKQLRKYIENQG